jgi:GH25 family lysozyme M1 (1,4-beta-N-acetylmuramidase)
MRGVDISHYQKGLAIKQIKDAGNEFAIIKITEGSWLRDGAAVDFYREAYEMGFPVGCYCYSHATTVENAAKEAQFLLDTINRFPMPCGVFLDMEEPKQLGLPKEKLLSIIVAWANAIADAGYIPGVYSSAGTLWATISPDEIGEKCLIWVAKWSQTPPDMLCDLWQTSDSGRIEGHDGNVDTDVALSDRFKKLVSSANYNREDKPPDVKPTQDAGVKAAVMVLQLLMSYAGYWVEVTGEKSNEFFNALHTFVEALEKS